MLLRCSSEHLCSSRSREIRTSFTTSSSVGSSMAGSGGRRTISICGYHANTCPQQEFNQTRYSYMQSYHDLAALVVSMRVKIIAKVGKFASFQSTLALVFMVCIFIVMFLTLFTVLYYTKSSKVLMKWRSSVANTTIIMAMVG